MRVPIIMCHGLRPDPTQAKPLPAEHFARLLDIAVALGCESIGYDQLAAWRAGTGTLPARPLMIDLDHPARTMLEGVLPLLAARGYRANLFVQTAPLEDPRADRHEWLTWSELAQLRDAGWQIGAHTHTHPNLSKLYAKDPSGELLQQELETNDELLHRHLGIVPRDFAFTGTSMSTAAARRVAARYRFGRLWIVSNQYQMDGQLVRYADLVGVPGEDLPDGGPPAAARYITRETPPYLLPSMEIQGLIHTPEAFRAYLEQAW